MNEQLEDIRADAAAQAEAAAQAKVQENLEAAKEAIQSSWFGEFDPEDEETAWARLTADITVLGTEMCIRDRRSASAACAPGVGAA